MVERRDFLKGSAAAAGLAAIGGTAAACAPAPGLVTASGLAGEAGIDHVVVVMMENRSFDHFLGWLPGADGKQAGLSFVDTDGVTHDTHRLEHYASCDLADPNHGYKGGRTQFNGGKNDGFLQTAPDTYPIGYYEQEQLLFWGPAASAWTICDNYFTATMGPTFPNRFFQHCGQTDRDNNRLTISSLPTIWDRLEDKGVQGRYYFSDAPFSALLGLRHAFITRRFDQFLGDAAAGRLANVSFVDPPFIIPSPPFGSSADYHPASDIRMADQWLHRVYEAVTNSPNWERTVLIINFDEWGGFFDHVPPTEGPDSNPLTALRGFRVPCLVASPLARRGHVAHDLYDHTSILRFIEWCWDLEPLAPRDAEANNIGDVLDLGGRPNMDPVHWTMPAFSPENCAAQWGEQIWDGVLQQARAQGRFPVSPDPA